MSSGIKKQTSKVTALSTSLDELEQKLEPLLSRPLSDTLSSLDTLQQAKLQVLLSYLINDLIFIYLKTQGIDPKTHPVISELDRVREYFKKIKDAEDSNKKRTTAIDKAAAGRFIKHAISEARRSTTTNEPTPNEAGPSDPQRSTLVPMRVTEKMKEREEYLRRVAEEEDSEEPILDVIDDAAEENSSSFGKGKGKAREEVSVVQEVTISEMAPKKRRRAMDPFGSFGEEANPASGSGGKPKKKKNKKIAAVIDNDASLLTDSRASSDIDSSREETKSKKRNKKKNRAPVEETT